jgi:polyhydroxybutyrate depolymerase
MTNRRTLLLGAVAAACTVPSARAQAPGVLPSETLEVDGRRRRYRLVAPPSVGPGAPLLIALHGMGIDSIALMPLYSGLDDLARETGSILVYPASLRDHWPLSFGPELQGELRFLDALMAHMARTRAIDPRQVYFLGMSNGGYFATVVASRRSRYIAGLAVHSGSAGVLGVGFETERKFPVYVAHGAADPIINVRDGRWLSGMFTRMGHPTRYEEFPGLGHIWARDRGVNARIWAHWRAHPA